VQKRHSRCQSGFALSGSAHAKAGCRMLMKLTPGQKDNLPLLAYKFIKIIS